MTTNHHIVPHGHTPPPPHPPPRICPVLFIVATTNYNIAAFFLTQESIMDCKEIRSRVRIYLFLNVSIKTIETIGAMLLVINRVGPISLLCQEAMGENHLRRISRALSLLSSFVPWPQKAFWEGEGYATGLTRDFTYLLRWRAAHLQSGQPALIASFTAFP